MTSINRYLILILLIFTTAVLLLTYNIGLYKTFTIKLDDTYSIVGVSDQIQGGETTIEVEKRADGIFFRCDIVPAYQWPYCEVKIHLVPQNEKGIYQFQNGLDLSEYDEVFLDVDYNGPKPERLRFYIRNYNLAYTNLETDENSMKINEVEFEPNAYKRGEFVQLSDFNVTSWWTGLREIPTEFQGREFTNVPLLEIASAGLAEYGEMEVFIHEITFRRLYISRENLLFSIIAMWVSSAIVYLVVQLSSYRLRLNNAKISKNRLLEILHALKLEKNQIDKMAKRDELTGLRNRAGLSKHFSECGLALTEKNKPFSIIFIDIDFFKLVNDVHGHNTGDDILISFAQAIYNNIRIADKLGRWGGEEFILICKNSGLESAVATAEKLCLIIEDKVFADNLKITASFGVAQMRSDESTRAFIERADKALYDAKANGRNQVQASK
ncbi:GGDEF domain-containing protein [Psychromonas hadalis]|uniref:GGDEF domain-containing protein n=1 Tax=Psychromonas hadalis TaxID=211669 RepID=UPI0003B7397F|nr:GGDEF domain-containing protein [Psychromonas hadalis]